MNKKTHAVLIFLFLAFILYLCKNRFVEPFGIEPFGIEPFGNQIIIHPDGSLNPQETTFSVLTYDSGLDSGYTQVGMCSDDNSWTKGEMTCRDYSLVESNCDDIGSDGRSALEACKVACDNCSTYKEITRRLPSPVEDTEEPSYAQFEGEDGGEFGGAGGIDTREILGKLDSLNDKLLTVGDAVGGVGETVTDSLQFTLDSLRGDNDKYRQLQLLDSDQSGSISLDELLATISAGSASAGGSSDPDAIRGNITLLSSNLKQRLVTFCEKTLLPLAENIKRNIDLPDANKITLTNIVEDDIDAMITEVGIVINEIRTGLDAAGAPKSLNDNISDVIDLYEWLGINAGRVLTAGDTYNIINLEIIPQIDIVRNVILNTPNLIIDARRENIDDDVQLVYRYWETGTAEETVMELDNLTLELNGLYGDVAAFPNYQGEVEGLLDVVDFAMIGVNNFVANYPTPAAPLTGFAAMAADPAKVAAKLLVTDAVNNIRVVYRARELYLGKTGELDLLVDTALQFNMFADKVRGLQNQLVTDLIGTANPPPGPGVGPAGPAAAAPGAGPAAAGPGAAGPGAAAAGPGAGVPAAADADAAATPLPEDDDGIGALEIGAGIGIAAGAATLAWFLFGGGDTPPAIRAGEYVRF